MFQFAFIIKKLHYCTEIMQLTIYRSRNKLICFHSILPDCDNLVGFFLFN